MPANYQTKLTFSNTAVASRNTQEGYRYTKWSQFWSGNKHSQRMETSSGICAGECTKGTVSNDE
jgi:hypothetical protein